MRQSRKVPLYQASKLRYSVFGRIRVRVKPMTSVRSGRGTRVMTQVDRVITQVDPPGATAAPWPVWRRLAIPLVAVTAAFIFIAIATLRWDIWVGAATVQTTDDAYVRADISRLASRVSGEVLTVAVTDFQRVKAGQ